MRALATHLAIGLMLGVSVVSSSAPVQAQPGPSFRSVSTDDLRKATTAGNDWLTFSGSLNSERYSTLDQITTSNVSQLKGAWLTRLGSGRGPKYKFESDPLVIDGVMYISTGNDDVFALDATNGRKLWTWESGIAQDNTSICCGWDNRGVAAGEGMIFIGLLDGGFAALDQKTGNLVWRTQLEDWHDGYSITGAARYFDGLVFTGMSGGEFGIRGRVYALDAKTGKEVWRFYTVPGPNDFGGDTWPNDGSYQHGGATVWQAPAIDPELGMLYFSTGNPGPWNGDQHQGDNLFANSIVALAYKTGQYKWHFQEIHHDIWDLDAPSPVVLFDQTFNGQPRQGLFQCAKTGWCYILDRTNGQPLVGINEEPVPQEPRQLTAPTQPKPVGDPFTQQCAEPIEGFPLVGCLFTPYWDIVTLFRPSLNGGALFNPMTYNPQTGYIYATGQQDEFGLAAKPQQWTNGRWYIGTAVSVPPGASITSTLTALDSRTNKIVWQKQRDGEDSKGELTTAGGLLFAGDPDGNLKAYAAKTGDELWSFQTGWGIDASPVTYSVNGQQYVAVAAGGNVGGNPTLDGDAVWAFKLGGNIDEVAAPPKPLAKSGFAGPFVTFGQPLARPGFNYDKTLFDGTIPIDDFFFTPSRVQVPVGTTVTWHNNGGQVHTATDSKGAWDTGEIDPGQDGSVTFDTPGLYTYNCVPHPWMMAQIQVQ